MDEETSIPFPAEALTLLEFLESTVPQLHDAVAQAVRTMDYTVAHENAGRLEQIQELRQWYEDTMEDIRNASANASKH